MSAGAVAVTNEEFSMRCFGGGEKFKPRLYHSTERTHSTPQWHLFSIDMFFKAQRNRTNWWPQKPTKEEYGHCFICLFLFFLWLFPPQMWNEGREEEALFLFTHFNALSPAFCEKIHKYFFFFSKFDIMRNLFLYFLAKSKKTKTSLGWAGISLAYKRLPLYCTLPLKPQIADESYKHGVRILDLKGAVWYFLGGRNINWILIPTILR